MMRETTSSDSTKLVPGDVSGITEFDCQLFRTSNVSFRADES